MYVFFLLKGITFTQKRELLGTEVSKWGSPKARRVIRVISRPSSGKQGDVICLKQRFFRKLDVHLSNEKILGCLGYIGDEILPGYIGIIIHHDKDPY